MMNMTLMDPQNFTPLVFMDLDSPPGGKITSYAFNNKPYLLDIKSIWNLTGNLIS